MKRLITFGDSFTYGHGLEDCWIADKEYPGPTPSKFAWPQHLGDMLELEVVNKSKCGWSNIQILKDIINFNLEPTDMIIVGWTYSLRDCIFSKNIFGVESEMRFSIWHKNTKFIKKYFDIHNKHDQAVRMGLYMHHAESYLKTKGVKQHHFCAYHGWYEVMPHFTQPLENFIPDEIVQHKLDIALDNSHPGPIAHRQAAERLYKILNDSK
jgi:hypothetical protein